MLGLEYKRGVNLLEVLKLLSEEKKVILIKIDRFLQDGLLKIKNDILVVNKEKWLLSEFISRELFILS